MSLGPLRTQNPLLTMFALSHMFCIAEYIPKKAYLLSSEVVRSNLLYDGDYLQVEDFSLPSKAALQQQQQQQQQ